MGKDISTGNEENQAQIFPQGMSLPANGLVRWHMRKKKPPEPQLIFLGAWIEALGVKVGDLARGADMSQSYVSNIIRNDKKDVSVQKMLRISEFLHVPVNDLYHKPPSAAQLAPFTGLSPEARAALLTAKPRKT